MLLTHSQGQLSYKMESITYDVKFQDTSATLKSGQNFIQAVTK